jgi:hypothetical protein
LRLIVLGRTNDDKGTQLEKLSTELLEALGFVRVATNVANSAGELDITGEFVTPMPVVPKIEKLIGECKALKSPLAMPDWLKFLGKLFVAKHGGENVTGCLIALSGVNGNVQGSFDELKLADVRLIGSSTLIEYLQDTHGLAPQARLNEHLAASGLTHSSIALAYYDRHVYWVILYDAGSYTVLTADVNHPNQTALDVVRPMIEDELEATTFVDLREAEALRNLTDLAEKYVIALAMLGDGTKTATEMIVEHIVPKQQLGLTEAVLKTAIENLIADGVMVSGTDRFVLTPEQSTDVSKRASLFNRCLDGRAVTTAFGCEWWDRNIDDALLEEIIQIQMGLQLRPEDREKAIRLMRLSPGALAYALRPDGMIVYKRTQEPKVEVDEDMIEYDRARFMRELYTRLTADFSVGGLGKYFFAQRRVDHLKRHTSITLTDRDQQVVITDEVTTELLILWKPAIRPRSAREELPGDSSRQEAGGCDNAAGYRR